MIGSWLKELLTQFFDYLKCWVLVNHYEEAVILRNGKYLKTLKPGLYRKWPFIDYSYTTNVKADTKEYGPRTITTLDGKTVTISIMIEYIIINSVLFLIENNDSLSNMKDVALAEMSDLLEDINWNDIKNKTTKNKLRRAIGEKFKSLGVEIRDLKFTYKCETKAFKLFSDKSEII